MDTNNMINKLKKTSPFGPVGSSEKEDRKKQKLRTKQRRPISGKNL